MTTIRNAVLLIFVLIELCSINKLKAQDISKYQGHELYPYLVRSKEILERLNENIKKDSESGDSFVRADAEAEQNEYQFLSNCLKDELAIIDNNTATTWQKFNVLSYGADPNGNNDSRNAFANAINAAKSYGSGAEIWIPNGTYIFNGSCELYGLKNMRFTADNATFIFTSVSAGLDVRQCRNFEITGVSIDYKQLPWTQGTLTGIVGNDVYVKFDNGYTELQNWHNASLRFYNPVTKLFIHSAYRWAYDKPNAQKQGNGDWKLPSLSAIDGRIPLEHVPIGSKVVILSRLGEDAYHYGLNFPSEWTYNAINLIGDEYVTFRNVNVYSAWEADIAAHGTNSGIRYINLHVEPKPGTDRLVCGNSDTHVHYTGRKGDFIYNSKISGGSDDGCDYASLMSNVNSWQSDKSFLISGGLDINWTPVRTGDGVWIVNPQGGPYRYFAKITNVENASGQTLVTLDRVIPQEIRSLSGNMILGVNSKFDGTVILNSEWSNGSANGIYLYCSNAVVENNTLSHFFYWASLFRMATPPFWNAGGATRNLLYTGNTINNNQLLSMEYNVPNPNPSQCLFRHINISNNKFTGTTPLSLNYISTSILSGNTYNIPGANPVSINNSCGDVVQNNSSEIASQSSTDFNGEASRAFDGNSSGDFQNSSVTHTKTEANPWWTLDRRSSKPIEQLKIYNRSDCCSQRLHDFYVFVSDDPFSSNDPTATVNTSGVWSYYFPGVAGDAVVLDVFRNARYIRIQIPGGAEVVSLAEVEFTSGKVATARSYSGEWDFGVSPEGWNLTHALTGAINSSVYNLNISASDPYMHSPDYLNLNASDKNLLVIRMKNNTASTEAELFWITNDQTTYEGGSKRTTVQLNPNEGDFSNYTIDLSSNSNWKGIIRQIRVDPSSSLGAGSIDIDYIGLKNKGIVTGIAENEIIMEYNDPLHRTISLKSKNPGEILSVNVVSINGAQTDFETTGREGKMEIRFNDNPAAGIYILSVVQKNSVKRYKLMLGY